MQIVETSHFTRQVQTLLTEEEYRELQANLVARPDAGVLIKGGGGVRKVRWGAKGRGKSGGIRTIYYWASEDETILMLMAYPKSELDDLTDSQVRVLRNLVKEEFG